MQISPVYLEGITTGIVEKNLEPGTARRYNADILSASVADQLERIVNECFFFINNCSLYDAICRGEQGCHACRFDKVFCSGYRRVICGRSNTCYASEFSRVCFGLVGDFMRSYGFSRRRTVFHAWIYVEHFDRLRCVWFAIP